MTVLFLWVGHAVLICYWSTGLPPVTGCCLGKAGNCTEQWHQATHYVSQCHEEEMGRDRKCSACQSIFLTQSSWNLKNYLWYKLKKEWLKHWLPFVSLLETSAVGTHFYASLLSKDASHKVYCSSYTNSVNFIWGRSWEDAQQQCWGAGYTWLIQIFRRISTCHSVTQGNFDMQCKKKWNLGKYVLNPDERCKGFQMP